MLLTPSGIITFLRLLFPLKALIPISSINGGVITLTGMQGGTFYYYAPQLIKRYEVLKFHTIPEGSGGCHHGVLESQRPYLGF